MMKIPFLEYQSALAYNRQVFSIEHGNLVKVFGAIDGNFGTLIGLPSSHRDNSGKSHISLLPFLLLLQRQCYIAFDLFTADQSYHAWLLIRPGIEAALIIGKWVDDPENAKIWQNRSKDWAAYQKAYSGKALRSTSLPASERIQSVLSKINDRFVHANPDYYFRHLNVGPGDPGHVSLMLNYFEDDAVQLVNVFAFLHLVLVVQESLLVLFNKLFSTGIILPSGLELFKSTFAKKINELTSANDDHKRILTDLGDWQ